jgi:anti-sigma regulatory factor (Ser/Thr protein kinase)
MSNRDTTVADEPQVKLELFSQPRYLAAARALVGCVAQRLGFNEIQCGQISLAVDEALCNVITHGYGRRPDGRMWLYIWPIDSNPPGLKVVIEDLARQVDPTKIQSRHLDDVRPGGLGVHIIREVMDEVVYERREGQGMRLTMIKHIRDNARDSEPAAEPVQERVEP